MNASNEAADQVVKMSLQGVEFGLKVTGKAAKEVAAFLIALSKSKSKVKGKASLNTMLKSGEPLSVFTIDKKDFKKFSEEAKKYGILYSALSDKNSKDGVIDILARSKDAAKVNRIVERFNFAGFKEAEIVNEVSEREKHNEKIQKEKGVQEKDSDVKIKEEEEKSPKNKEKQSVDPYSGRQAEENQSEPSSKNSRSSKTEGSSVNKKSSVKEELNKYKEVVKNREKNKTTKEVKRSTPKKNQER